MRFVAALAVLGFHLSGYVGRTALRHVDVLVGQGGLGVDFFFVLSGFILTWSAAEGDRARDFYRRRFARVYPNHFVMWLVVGVCLAAFSVRPSGGGAVASLFLLQAWDPHTGVYFAVNGVAWTLSCEAFFYAVFPFVLLYLRRLNDRALYAALVALLTLWVALGVAMTAWDSSVSSGTTAFWLTHVFPPVRLVEFIIGMSIGCLVIRGKLRVPLLPVTIATIALYLSSRDWSGSEIASHVLVGALGLLIAAVAFRDIEQGPWWLSGRVAVTLGAWSFALYLVHQRLFQALRWLVGTPTSIITAAVFFLTGIALAVAAAGALFHLVERPAERRLRRGRRRPEEASAL
jgi:peptidoglycan/LPS O-acetylase OafA/YrhL